MWAFDENLRTGAADQGDNQNGKGDFFTDLLSLLLERCSEKELSHRPSVPGLIFRNHSLDAVYPAVGVPEILIETKVAGAPRTARNPSQKNDLGRAGSSDLDKRIKEASLKTIDLKAQWARLQGQGGGPSGDFISWLVRTKPSCFLLLAVRVIHQADVERAKRITEAAKQFMDGCGLFCYEPCGQQYRLVDVPTHFEMDRVLSRICDALRQLP